MTRTGLLVSMLSMVIMIVLTRMFPTVMGIIIVLSILGIILFVTYENSKRKKEE